MHGSYKAERAGSSPVSRTTKISSRSLTVRIPDFHSGGRGSIPLGSTTKLRGNMYRIDNFNVGDKLYRFIGTEWKYVTTIVEKSYTNYGIHSKHIKGIVVVERFILENEGLIALSKESKK
tara:strand:+ start:1670 stop:2029 length:360 start_codon:yes stop_codon:yes gene_type:complete